MGHPKNGMNAYSQPAADGAEGPARIGPNAILRVAEALGESYDPETRARVFQHAGLLHYLGHPPSAMVDEREVSALHQSLRELLGVQHAREIGRDAGLRTGDYLLANRIPALAQTVLRLLPAGIAERLLLKAIARNAWTFAGSATFTAKPGCYPHFVLAGSPICRGASASLPLCDFYAATFQRLFRVLIDPRTQVVEMQCQAKGDRECIFAIYRQPRDQR
jgi:divinyl protochlorophyllide a 8-vinyl-reductase